jgi:threonylcarbamoyladenosine tRNA methylthiotransferase MtaB
MPKFPLQYSSGDRTRTFFKIQDGCDYFCTYCAIPFARGRSRSATIEETLCMARRIADEGAKEVVLTGVNTGTFGQMERRHPAGTPQPEPMDRRHPAGTTDTPEPMDRRHPAGTTHPEPFLDLLRGLDQIDGIQRYRISSIEPNLLTDDIIDFVASSRAFLPHFHIPLQAGSDHVLQLMHRRYDTALYRAKLERIKAVMPDACIAADVMAGFNGENEEEFAKVLSFIDSLPISYLHVFTYSDRPGTAALRLGEKIPIPVRHEHTARLLELSEKKHNEFISSQIGKTRPILWESKPVENATLMEGWTDNYIRLSRPYDPALVATITLETITPDNLVRKTID